MSSNLVLAALVAPAPLAVLLSFMAQSPPSRRILRSGGLVYSLTLGLAYVLRKSCSGDFLYGFGTCDPDWLTAVAHQMGGVVLLLLFSYMLVGPVLLVTAAILELVARRT